MLRRKNNGKMLRQHIGFLPRLGKKYVCSAALRPRTACAVAVFIALAPLCFWGAALVAPAAQAATVSASSAQNNTVDDMYFEGGSFGTSKSEGPQLESAPDGSRTFKTGKKAPDEAGQVERIEINVQPEIWTNSPKPTPPRPNPPRPNPPKPTPPKPKP